jgi:glutathione S-transferase
MPKLYDCEISGSCYKIRLLLNMLDVGYDSVAVDFVNKEHKSAPYLALNPFGEIPIFEDRDLRLRDAQAILVYIAGKYDKSRQWFPEDPESQGRIAQWLSTGGGEIMNAAAARLVKVLKYPLDLDKLHAGAHRVFKIMDDHLATRLFLELERPTIADLACFPYTALAPEGGIDLGSYKNVLGWIDRIKHLPGFVPMPGIPTSVRR